MRVSTIAVSKDEIIITWEDICAHLSWQRGYVILNSYNPQVGYIKKIEIYSHSLQRPTLCVLVEPDSTLTGITEDEPDKLNALYDFIKANLRFIQQSDIQQTMSLAYRRAAIANLYPSTSHLGVIYPMDYHDGS